jgi:membrane-associated phospholipid phosphatase
VFRFRRCCRLRPVAARDRGAIADAADRDGDPASEPDLRWNNLHRHTYAFPSYPSAHGTVCSAAMTVMADMFGERHAFTMTIPEVDEAGPASGKMKMEPPTRHFPSFPAAALECSLSRVYLGIHFRYDSLAGNALGNRVGRYAVERFLKESS